MAKDLWIVWAGRHRREPWESLCESYRSRIEDLDLTVLDRPVRTRGGGPDRRRQRLEGEALLAVLPRRCWSVALDRRGEPWSSVELSKRLSRLRQEWPHSIAFLIGSDLGLDRLVLDQARQRLSLGPLTLPHELARLVLYEQLYRALAIDRGINYHRHPLQ